MSISWLSVAILALFATVLVIEIYRGAKGGLLNALISFGSMFASLLSAIIATPLVSRLIVSSIEENLLGYLPIYSYYEMILETLPSFREFAIALSSMALGLVLFWVIFAAFRALFGAICDIACKMSAKRRKDDVGYCQEKESLFYKNDKLMGGIVGAVSAVLLTIVIISPLMGALDTFDRAYSSVEVLGKDVVDNTNIDRRELNNIRQYKNDICGKFLYELGGKQIYRHMTSTTMYGERVFLLDELDAIHDALALFKSTYNVIKEPDMAGPKDAERIRQLGESIGDLKITRGILADVISNGTALWVNGETFFGMSKPQLPSLISKPFDDMLTVCSATNEESLPYNLATIFNLYALVIDTDLPSIDFEDFDSAFTFVNETKIIERINEELSRNKYMKHIKLTSISMAAVAQQLNGDMLTDEQFDTLSDSLASAINSVNGRGYGTHEEKVDALSTYAKDYILEAGVDVPDSVVAAVAEELLSELPEEGEITPEDIKNLFDKYAE